MINFFCGFPLFTRGVDETDDDEDETALIALTALALDWDLLI